MTKSKDKTPDYVYDFRSYDKCQVRFSQFANLYVPYIVYGGCLYTSAMVNCEKRPRNKHYDWRSSIFTVQIRQRANSVCRPLSVLSYRLSRPRYERRDCMPKIRIGK